MALAARGDHSEAAQSFERTVQLQPMNPHAWYQLGMAWHTLHDPDKVKAWSSTCTASTGTWHAA